MLKYEDDGICMAEDSDALQEITDISQVQGDWWVLKGQNCGQDEIWRGKHFSLFITKNVTKLGSQDQDFCSTVKLDDKELLVILKLFLNAKCSLFL